MSKRRYWTRAEEEILRELYPDTPTKDIAQRLGRTVGTVYQHALAIGLRKSAAYLASPHAQRMRRGDNIGIASRFPKGHVPANKGLRRPSWAPGRMAETQFKKGGFPANRDPDYCVLGALRVNADGYIDMRVSFAPGAKGWRGLHQILWEDAHGPIPQGFAVCFKNGDKLDVELGNLELVSRADLMRRNTVHRLPAPLRSSIQLLGQLKRRIRERTDKATA